MESTTASATGANATGAIRRRNKSTGSIAKRACDQCKFRKIKVTHFFAPFQRNVSAHVLHSVACRSLARLANPWALTVHFCSRRRNADQPDSKSFRKGNALHRYKFLPHPEAAFPKFDSSKLIFFRGPLAKTQLRNRNPFSIMFQLQWNPARPFPYRGHHGHLRVAKFPGQ